MAAGVLGRRRVLQLLVLHGRVGQALLGRAGGSRGLFDAVRRVLGRGRGRAAHGLGSGRRHLFVPGLAVARDEHGAVRLSAVVCVGLVLVLLAEELERLGGAGLLGAVGPADLLVLLLGHELAHDRQEAHEPREEAAPLLRLRVARGGLLVVRERLVTVGARAVGRPGRAVGRGVGAALRTAAGRALGAQRRGAGRLREHRWFRRERRERAPLRAFSRGRAEMSARRGEVAAAAVTRSRVLSVARGRAFPACGRPRGVPSWGSRKSFAFGRRATYWQRAKTQEATGERRGFSRKTSRLFVKHLESGVFRFASARENRRAGIGVKSSIGLGLAEMTAQDPLVLVEGAPSHSLVLPQQR